MPDIFSVSYEEIAQTIPEHIYEMSAFESSGNQVQQVELTRDEYIALKEHLCELRGLKPSTGATRGEL